MSSSRVICRAPFVRSLHSLCPFTYHMLPWFLRSLVCSGVLLLLVCFVTFIATLYAVVFSKFMPKTGHHILDWLSEDRCGLVLRNSQISQILDIFCSSQLLQRVGAPASARHDGCRLRQLAGPQILQAQLNGVASSDFGAVLIAREREPFWRGHRISHGSSSKQPAACDLGH